jgi:hypothetical protein
MKVSQTHIIWTLHSTKFRYMSYTHALIQHFLKKNYKQTFHIKFLPELGCQIVNGNVSI